MTEREIFFEALEMGTLDARAAYLQGACGQDVTLRRKVDELLKEHFSNDSLLAGPALEGERPTLKLDIVPEAAPAQMLGRYKLLEKIGEGGFGEVWMAEQREPVKRRVALKIIKLGMDSRQIIARFEAERQALAMMDHPNIAKIFDAGAIGEDEASSADIPVGELTRGEIGRKAGWKTGVTGRPYFVMELVRGIKITEYCDQNQLPTQERLRLFILVCQAIQHAHQKGIIHRDIKPSNILVTLHDGVPVPKVIDFGIAKATQQELTDKTVFTQFQQFIGTPAYISPEQAEMSGLDIDTRADIYSLGVLLYELLVGQTPFDAKEMMQSGLDALRQIIREREPLRPSTKLNTLPGDARTTAGKRRQTDVGKLIHQLQGDLDWIVMKCLEKDRTRRYETANGLAADIKRHLDNEPVIARPPSAAYKFQKAWQRNKLMFTAATTVTAALVIGIGISTWQTIRATRAEREQSKLREVAVKALDGEKEQRAHAEANEAEARRAQANESALRQLAQDATSRLRQSVYAADMNVAHHALEEGNLGRAGELLNNHVTKDGAPDLRGFEWRYMWGLSRGDAEHMRQAHHSAATCVAYSPDGTTLVTAGFDRTLKVWGIDSDEGAVASLTFEGRSLRRSIAFSAKGDMLATAVNGELILRDAGTWQLRENLGPVSERDDVISIVFLRDDLWIAARTIDGVMLRKISSNERQTIMGDGQDFGTLLAYCPEPNVLAIANGTEIQLWDAETLVLHKTIGGNDSVLVGLVSSKRGDVLAAGRKDGSVELIAIAEQRVVRAWKAHASLAFALDFSPDGRILATGGADQLIQLWDTQALSRSSATPQPLRTLRGHENQVWALAFSPDGRKLASASKDGRIALWKAQPEELSGDATESSIAFGPLQADARLGLFFGREVRSFDGRLLARAQGNYSEATVELRDADSDRLLFKLPGHRINISSMAFSPSDKLLVTGGHDNLIRLWDTKTGNELFVLRGHFTAVTALTFTSDERTLASGSSDGTVKLWSVKTGQEMISQPFSHGTVVDLKFSKNGQALGVRFASESPLVQFLRAPSWEEIAAAEAKEKVESKQP